MHARLAVMVGELSTCRRLRVGCVVTSVDFERVLAFGYNGNARGFDNACDRDEIANCGCVHAETNALIKAATGPKAVFATVSPCVLCAKLMVNAGVQRAQFSGLYRLDDGLRILSAAGIDVSVIDP